MILKLRLITPYSRRPKNSFLSEVTNNFYVDGYLKTSSKISRIKINYRKNFSITDKTHNFTNHKTYTMLNNLNPQITQEQLNSISRYVIEDILNQGYDFETLKLMLGEEWIKRVNTVFEDQFQFFFD